MRGYVAEAIVGGQGGVALLDGESGADFVRVEVVGEQSTAVEVTPVVVGEVKDLGASNRKGTTSLYGREPRRRRRPPLRRSMRHDASLTMIEVTGAGDH